MRSLCFERGFVGFEEAWMLVGLKGNCLGLFLLKETTGAQRVIVSSSLQFRQNLRSFGVKLKVLNVVLKVLEQTVVWYHYAI
jgi:hypothetical protein